MADSQLRSWIGIVALGLVSLSASMTWSQSVAAQAQAASGASASAQPTAAAPLSPGDEEKARAHFRLGRAYYDNGDFAQAAAEFEEAYRISQRAALLYNIYLAYRDANDTRHAAEALRNYLTLEKDVENRGQLEARLTALDRSLADGSAPQPAAAPVAAQPVAPDAVASAQPALPPEAAPVPSAATDATQDEAAHKTNLVPFVLMGGGGAMIITGLVVGAMASGKASDLDKLCPNKQCGGLDAAQRKEAKDTQSSGKTLALVSDLLTFGGIAVAGTGAVLFILDQMKGNSAPSDDTAASASLACLPGSCGGSVRLKF